MYDWSREACFKERGMADVRSFKERVDKRIDLNHHDLGFLYSPSCVAAYQLCQSEEGKQAALQAADILMERYREKGHFIQAWGNVGDPKDYRLIIDCMLNIPLLYWKSRVTGDERYEKAAREHFITSCNNVVRMMHPLITHFILIRRQENLLKESHVRDILMIRHGQEVRRGESTESH